MTRRILPLVLACATLSAATLPAFAQDGPSVADENASKHEAAFLRAYYLETALRDWKGAEAAYRRLVGTPLGDAKLLARARLGLARSLAALGRDGEARTLIDLVRKEHPDLPDLKDLSAARLANAAGDAGDLKSLVAHALTQKPAKEVADFGDRAVPVLAEELRGSDPAFVKKAAETLLLIDTEAGHAALEQAVSDPRVLYPLHLLPRMTMDTRAPALAAAAQSSDPALRDRAFRIFLGEADSIPDTIVQRVIGDPELRARHLPADSKLTSAHGWARLVMAGLQSGDAAARSEAIASLHGAARETSNPNDGGTEPLYDPPASVLADEEALGALRHAFLTMHRKFANHPELRPSDALVARMLETDDGVRVVADWAIEDRALPDADVFTKRLAELPRDVYDGVPSTQVAASLRRILGKKPKPEHLQRLARGGLALGDFEAYLHVLWRTGLLVDGPTFRALQAGCETPAFESKLLDLLERRLRKRVQQPAAWIAEAYGDALASESVSVRMAAGKGMLRLATLGVDVSAHFQGIARLFDIVDYADPPKTAAAILARGGEPGARAILEGLRPDHPHLGIMLRALSDARQPVAVEALTRLLLTPNSRQSKDYIVLALLRCADGDVADTLRAAIVLDGGAEAESILATLHANKHLVPETTIRDLYLHALEERLPDIDWSENDPNVWEDVRTVEPLVLAALRSSNSDAKRWAAGAAGEMLLQNAWEDLLAAAADPDPATRKAARGSLRAVRDAEAELEALRAAGEQRASRVRARKMLSDGVVDTRRAGIALAVAVRMPGAVDALTRLAQSDPSDDVREDARRALLSLGQVRDEPQPK